MNVYMVYFYVLLSMIIKIINHCLVKYKYEEQNLKKICEKENAHDDMISSCVELNDGTIKL